MHNQINRSLHSQTKRTTTQVNTKHLIFNASYFVQFRRLQANEAKAEASCHEAEARFYGLETEAFSRI